MERTHYTQLTLEERYHIQVMRKQGKSLRSIAIGMGRSHSTLSREFLRNHGGRGGSAWPFSAIGTKPRRKN